MSDSYFGMFHSNEEEITRTELFDDTSSDHSWGSESIPTEDDASACSVVEEDGFHSDEEDTDIALECEDYKKVLPPIKDIVISLRKQRNRGMVQTEEQYRFIYRSVMDELKRGKPSMPQDVHKFLQDRVGKKC